MPASRWLLISRMEIREVLIKSSCEERPLAANSEWRDVANQNSLYIKTLDCRAGSVERRVLHLR